jgi:hypothetical protein
MCTQASGASSSLPLGRLALPRLGRCFVTTLNHFFKKQKPSIQDRVMFLLSEGLARADECFFLTPWILVQARIK